MAKSLRIENADFDAMDAKILRILLDDARTSVAEIARQVGMSPPGVSERIKRLEERGTIEGYSVRINPGSLGLPLSAWLRIRPVPGQLNTVADILRDIPEIASCDRVTGEDCFIARVHVRSILDLERVIDRIIPHAMTNTAIIQSSPVEQRLPASSGA
ncbi:MAG TPA: Lrp/AsnC family transcriptional regulator [Rhizobiaceae bacterium]|nr:Lrp/AsnC family transcriptional regulator [Rhizobiaceae bacterium]